VTINSVSVKRSFFSINSSVLSFLKYRQYILFIYVMCILGFVYFFINVLYSYSIVMLLDSNYIGSTFFRRTVSSSDANIIHDLLLSNYSTWISSTNFISLCDKFMLLVLYMPYLHNVSNSYLEFGYSLHGWNEFYNEGIFKGNFLVSKLNNIYDIVHLDANIIVKPSDVGYFGDTEFGLLSSNVGSANYLFGGIPYHHMDSGIAQYKYIYFDTRRYNSSYISIYSMYCMGKSNFINWQGDIVFDYVGNISSAAISKGDKLEVLPYNNAMYSCLNIHKINILSRYVYFTSYNTDISDIFVRKVSSESFELGQYQERYLSVFIPEASNQIWLESNLLLNSISSCTNILYLTLDESFNNVYVNIASLQSKHINQISRITICGVSNFFDKIYATNDVIHHYYNTINTKTDTNMLHYFNYKLLPDIYKTVGCKSCGLYLDIKEIVRYVRMYAPLLFLWSDYKQLNCDINTQFKYLYDCTGRVSNLYSNELVRAQMGCSDISLYDLNIKNGYQLYGHDMLSYLNSTYMQYLNLYNCNLKFGECTNHASGLSGYNRVYMEACKYNNSSLVQSYCFSVRTIINYELDVIYSTFHGTNISSDLSIKSAGFQCGNSKGIGSIINYYGYNTQNSYIVSSNFTYAAEYTMKYTNMLLLYENMYNLLLSLKGVALLNICSVYLKVLYIVYPFIYIALIILIFCHIIYAYEFLLNDYIECLYTRLLLSNILLFTLYLCLYFNIYGIFLSDFYGNILLLGSKFDMSCNYDLCTGIDNSTVNMDEIYINFMLNFNYLFKYLPCNFLNYSGDIYYVGPNAISTFYYYIIMVDISYNYYSTISMLVIFLFFIHSLYTR